MAKSCFIPSNIGMYFIFSMLILMTASEIIPYQRQYLEPLNSQYLTIPKFAPKDAPNWAPGYGKSYIDLSRMTFNNDCDGSYLFSDGECRNSTFEILMFEEPRDKYWMDYWPGKQLCCTAEMASVGDCNVGDINTLINPEGLSGSFLRTLTVMPDVPMTLDQNGVVAHHDIKKSGVYILCMAVCDQYSPRIRIAGNIDSLDPYGYLPADLFGNLPFYGALSLAYTVVGLVWLIYCMFHSENLMPLQFWITLVLALGMIETTVLFFQYLKWNDYGTLSLGVTYFALIFGVLKRAVSRVVVLLVTLGYGVVRPSLGSQMGKVLMIGLSYFILSLYYSIFNSLPTRNKKIDDPNYTLFSLCIILLAGVDTTFYCWVFLSINNILAGLAARQSAAKYLLYRNFRVVLLVSLTANCLWVLYGSVIRYNIDSGEDNNWKDRWTVDALWESTYFLIFVAIAIMWAPSKDFSKYAYHEELLQLEDDSEYSQNGIELDEQSSKKDNKNGDHDVDAEYGGRLNDEDDPYNNPYKGKGALDPMMAIAKKQ